jgi:energy-coupling factor transporter ATP-binding protein EcfA2
MTSISAPSVLLISGPTGSGKTSLLATAAEWLWKKHKKVLRLYTADGGGYGTYVGSLVKLGIIEVFRMRTRASSGQEGVAEETLLLASQGYWPETFTSVERGEVEPGCRMVSPITTTYRMSCMKGHLLREVTDHRLLAPIKCNQCGISVSKAQAMIQKSSAKAEHMSLVGGVAMEGLTSWSSWHLQSMSDRRARQELHGEKSNIGAFTSGEMALDGNNRADYGFVQQAAERWLQAATTIQGLAIPPVFTALETAAEDAGVGPIWGPAIAGQAKTSQVPQWVGDYLGTQKVRNADSGKDEFRLMLAHWRSEDGRWHPYKTRATPGTLPEYLADAHGAEAFSGFNLGKYFDLLEDAEKVGSEKLTRELGEVPGLRVQRVKEVIQEEKTEERPVTPPADAGKPMTGVAGSPIAGGTVRAPGRAPVPIRRAVPSK